MAERITKTIVARYQADTRDMLAGLKSIDASAAQLARSMTSLEKTTGLFFKALSGYYTFMAVKETIASIGGAIVETADAMRQFEVQANRLAGTSAGFDLVAISAQKVKIGFEDALGAINSLAPALTKIGVSFSDTLKFVEDLTLSFRTFGVQGKAADSILTQLSQALSSGKLQGDELRSLSENAGGLYAELEKVVNQILGTNESLRVLGSDGVLSAELIYEAFNKVFEGLRDDFGDLTDPVAQSLTVVSNEMSLLTASINEALGFTNALAAALQGVADAAKYVRVDLFGDTTGLNVDELKTQLAEARNEMEAARSEVARLDEQYRKLQESELLVGKNLHLAGLTVEIDDANRAVTETTRRVIEITNQLSALEDAANGAAGGFANLKDGMTDAQFEVYEEQLGKLQEQLEKTKRALQVEAEGEGWVRLSEVFDAVADLPTERANELLALTQATVDAEQQLADIKAEKVAQDKLAADALREQEQLERQAARDRQQELEEQARAQEKLRNDAMQYYYDTLTMEEKHANSVKVVEQAYADGLVTFVEYSRAIAGLNEDMAQHQQDQAEKAAKEQEKLAKEAANAAKQYDAFGNEISTVYDLIKDGAEEAAAAIQNNLADAFYQLFTGTLDTAADWMEQFKKIVLQAIAQLIAALLSSQIIVPIIAQIIPVSGGSAGVSALSGSSGVGGIGVTGGSGSILDMLGGGNPLSGMTSWIGGGVAYGLEAFGVPTGVATGIGAMAGTALGYGAVAYGIGSAIGGPNVGTGAAIGSAIGSVVGSVIPVVGTVIGGVVGGVLGGAVGSLFGGGGSAKGPTGTGVAYLAVENGQIVSKGAEGIADPQPFIDAINAMNAQIMEMAAQMPGGAEVLQGINIAAQQVTPETFDQFMQDTFGQIASQLGNNLGGLFLDAWNLSGKDFDTFMAMLDEIEKVRISITQVTQANVFEGFSDALQYSVLDQIEAADERIRMIADPKTVAELEELYNLSQSRYQMEIAYLLQLESVMENLQANADAAREQILLAGTSEQQQYEYYREQANAALSMLESAATPEEIALYSDRALGYLMQSYQTLPEDLQAQYKAEFLSLIDYIEQVSGERAQAAAEVSMEQYNATMAILAETQYQSTYLNGISRDTTQMNAELVEIKNTLKTQRYSF